MKTETIVYCVVALMLGMLLANMLKSVCGCKVFEGNSDESITLDQEIGTRVMSGWRKYMKDLSNPCSDGKTKLDLFYDYMCNNYKPSPGSVLTQTKCTKKKPNSNSKFTKQAYPYTIYYEYIHGLDQGQGEKPLKESAPWLCK